MSSSSAGNCEVVLLPPSRATINMPSAPFTLPHPPKYGSPEEAKTCWPRNSSRGRPGALGHNAVKLHQAAAQLSDDLLSGVSLLGPYRRGPLRDDESCSVLENDSELFGAIRQHARFLSDPMIFIFSRGIQAVQSATPAQISLVFRFLWIERHFRRPPRPLLSGSRPHGRRRSVRGVSRRWLFGRKLRGCHPPPHSRVWPP